MIIRCCIICALLVHICTVDIVFSQVAVEGVIGGSVLLPCVSSKNEHKLQDISVLWRHNGSMNVFAITDGRGSVEDQDVNYKNRVKTFPEEYEKGNFSIIIYNLKHADAGEHQCYIGHSFENLKVQLLVNESTKAKENLSAIEKEGKVETMQTWKIILITVFCVSVLLLIGIGIWIKLKKPKRTDRSSSGVSTFEGLMVAKQDHHDDSGLKAD